VDLVAEFMDSLADMVDLFSGGMGTHGNDHSDTPFPDNKKTHSFKWVKPNSISVYTEICAIGKQ
jgi:hypothetical protein